jgi:hypothetical protein
MFRLTRLRLGAVAVFAFTLLAAPAATGEQRTSSTTASDVTGAVGQPVTLDNEQIHTVVQVERWWGGGYWFVKKGDASITVKVRVQATGKTSCNSLYYGLRTASGQTYGRVVLGGRDPGLESTNDLTAGQTHEGWLTFVTPEKDVNSLTLVYRMHSGFGSTLIVPLGVPRPSPSASIRQAITLDDEQVHTVLRAERWPGAGLFRPKAGQTYVTAYVRVKALKSTTVGGSYYSLRDGAGNSYRGPVFGSRKPELVWKKALTRGQSVEGWVTLLVPKAQARSLTLIYHMQGGSQPTLLVRLSAS